MKPALALALLGLGASLSRAAAGTDAKADYRVYLLFRDPAREAASPGHADPVFGLAADLKREIEGMGATLEKSGSFETPTAEGGARGNEVTVWRARWTKAQAERAQALGRGIELLQVEVEPASAPARSASARRGIPPSAADLVAARVRRQIGVAVPPALLSGEGGAFDGSRARDAVVDDYSRAAARLGTTVRALPKDPKELARLLHSSPAPARAPVVAAVPPPGGALPFDAAVEKAAARSGVSPDVLRGLLFASQGYAGGFARASGLHGPMGLSRATGRGYGLDSKTIDDPAANIAAGAAYFKRLERMFGGDLSRSVAAFYCGSGAVRRSRGIPAECGAYVSQFYLAYQNGAAWAIDRNAPRQARPVTPPEPVSRLKAVERAAREDADAAVEGDTPSNRGWRSRVTPPSLIALIEHAASRNAFDPSVSLDPDILLGLSWAEGGYSPENKRPNAWGAVGPMQVTYSGAEPHCREAGPKGRPVFDWKSISRWSDPKNVECGAKVFYDRIQWTKTRDPIIGLALYNTQQKHWDRIIARNKVPPFPETVAYVVRAATIACARSGRMILTQDHFENKTALRLARAEQRRLVRSEFPYEGNEVPEACRLFR